MLGDAGDIKMTVRQMVADILAGIAHTAIHRRMQRLINYRHTSEQQLLQQIDRQ